MPCEDGLNLSMELPPMAYQTLKTSITNHVATLTLDRADAMNALNAEMLDEVAAVFAQWEADDEVRVIVLTGSDKAFAAGADIKEMLDIDYLDALKDDFLGGWNCIAQCRKPKIAAVAGYALGGGCEVAMMCDFILAADNARFGQPEIRIGTMPGLGGTQRLTRLVGAAKAMEMCLTGRMMDAEEAERSGLVSRVIPLAEFRQETQNVAESIAQLSASAVFLTRESVLASANTTLEQGLASERRAFLSLFGSDDQHEGMSAFVEKRDADFSR